MRARVTFVIVAVVVAMFAMTSGSVADATATPYVALGDSYTSAPLVLPISSTAPLDCLQSGVNYPHLAAQHFGFTLTDVSCAGATSANMTTWQYFDQPPQFDALSSSTKVVTLGIGGNDNGLFASALISCGVLDFGNIFDLGSPCKWLYGSYFSNLIASDASTIAGVISGIHSRSPQAKVFVVGYPDILPQSGRCYPTMPLTTGDTSYLNNIEKQLNSMLSTQAAANNAVFVDTFTPSIGHDACKSASVRWIEPIVATNGGISVHPNGTGEAHTAGTVENAMTAAGVS
jgi:hypothetical protein